MGKPSKIGAHLGMSILSRLWAALQFGHGVSHNSGGSGIPITCTGVRKTLTSCQQNPILFGWARLTTPTRLGFLFRLTFPVTSRCNGNYDFNTKHKDHWYGSKDSSWCRLHRDSNAINSIITQKQLYLTRKTVGTSGMVPGEHTVGQTWLTVQLAVGSQRTASRSRHDLL